MASFKIATPLGQDLCKPVKRRQEPRFKMLLALGNWMEPDGIRTSFALEAGLLMSDRNPESSFELGQKKGEPQ